MTPKPHARSMLGRAVVGILAIGALALQGGAAWGANWVVSNEQHLKDNLIALQFEPSADIERYVREAGLSELGELYLMTSLPEVVPSYEFERYCSRSEPGIGVLGCYTLRDQRIYLYDVTDPRLTSMEPVVAAHEMLHAAWDRLSATEQERLGVLLEQAFGALPDDHELRTRIESYESTDPSSRIPELYAIIGTEISTLPAELEEHYSLYFANRQLSVALAEAFYLVFDTLVAERDELVQNLESRVAEIEGLKYTYEESAASLRVDIEAFNERAATPGAFPSKSEFDSTRNALVERQNRLEGLRVTLQQKIDEYNSLLDELTSLNTELTELNEGINITLEAQEELAEDPELVE